MSSPINAQLTGTFTSDGNAFNLDIPSEYTEIELTNLTDIGSTASSTPVMKAWGFSSMADGEGIHADKTNGAATIALPTTVSSDGFTFLSDSGSQELGAENSTITDISDASPPVVSLTSTTGLADGDRIRLYNTTGALQLSGIDYTIDNLVTDTSFELIHVGTAPGDNATAGTLRRVSSSARYYPRHRVITAVTEASSAVITLSVVHGLTAGQAVRFKVPSDWGMVELDGLEGNITAVDTSNNTITVDIDSSSFTSFAYPSSATAAAGVDFPIVVPFGETANGTFANDLDDATDNQAIRGVTIGTAVQTDGKEYQWVARKGTSI
ncbi:MAG: hypothetical protein ACLFUW_00255 [Bacteroidales bacterium]